MGLRSETLCFGGSFLVIIPSLPYLLTAIRGAIADKGDRWLPRGRALVESGSRVHSAARTRQGGRGGVMRLDTLLVSAVSILPAAHLGRRSLTCASLADPAALWVDDQPWEEVEQVVGGVILDVDEGIEPSIGAEASDDVTALLKAANLPDAQVSLSLCNDEAIAELNCQWRGKDRPTDVLSFPLEDEVMLGDLVISVETAAQQAASRGHSLRDEVRVLMVHGMLHLLGHDPMLRAGQARAAQATDGPRLAEARGILWRRYEASGG